MDAANINGTNNVGLTDNYSVSRWFDMSGNGRHASNEVSGTRMPHFKTGVFGSDNSLGAVYFDKSQNEFLTTVGFDTGDNLTMIAVYNYAKEAQMLVVFTAW